MARAADVHCGVLCVDAHTMERLDAELHSDLVTPSTWNAREAIRTLVEELGAFQTSRALPPPLARIDGCPLRSEVDALT